MWWTRAVPPEHGAAWSTRAEQHRLAGLSAAQSETPVQQPAAKEGAFQLSFPSDRLCLPASQLPQTSAYCPSRDDN